MDAFLIDASKSNHACASVEDLALQLANLRDTKATDTKAEHISATFEFRSTVVFNVPENESDAADPSQNLDQALGVTPGALPTLPMNGNHTTSITRQIRAHDTLINQPTDDPALQKLVAKHIIACLGSVDGSLWTVRSVSRNSSGWTFTYLCKNSTQAWMRQNSKQSAKLRIAESSGKDGQDPVNLSRPAFDCRGSVAIAFAKSSRVITVKLEHTPLHKTVAELAELFKPPPPLAKAVAARRTDGHSRKRKGRVDGAEAPEDGSKKKRRKKNTNAGEQTANGEQAPKAKKPRASRAKKSQNAGVQPQAEGQDSALLNLSPLETARRQGDASKTLRDKGIDPETLSSEQFNIFANQSPDLQMESLAMLVKYGAERLRIVHPDQENAEQSGHADPATGDAADASAKKKTSRKKAPRKDGAPKVKKTRGSCQACRAKKIKCSKAKPECEECVGAGIACYYPPEQKRKPVGAKSAEVAEDEPEEPEAGLVPNDVADSVPDSAPAPAPEPVSEVVPEEEEASDLGSPGFDTSHAPAPEMLPHPADTTGFTEASHDVSQDLYHPVSTGLSYPQGVGVPEDLSNNADYFQQQPGSNGIAYPHQPQQTSNVAYTDAPRQHVPEPEPVPVERVQAPSQPNHSTLPGPGTRRGLPSGSGRNQSDYSNSTDAVPAASSWQPTNTPANTAQTYSDPPAIAQSAPSRKSRSKRSAAPPAYEASARDALQAATTLTHAALQHESHTSPTTRTVSPFQNPTQAAQVARAKSRQSQRPSSRQTASPFQPSTTTQPYTAGTAPSLYNAPSATDSNNLSSYDQYPRYNTTTTQAATTNSRVAYEPYSQQTTPSSLATSYSGYDNYNSRSQPSNPSLANPVTQSASTSAPSSKNWASSNGRRGSNSYTANKATATATPAYNVPASSTQQQSTTMQSFNVRPQSTAPTQSRTSNRTPASYAQQPRQQQQQQQQQQPQPQQAYNSFSSQAHPAATPQQQQQQQQDWYGFGSTNSATSNYGSGSYSQHRSMNLAGNTYTSINDQEALYEMLRNNPRH